jgi:hypothetical protein
VPTATTPRLPPRLSRPATTSASPAAPSASIARTHPASRLAASSHKLYAVSGRAYSLFLLFSLHATYSTRPSCSQVTLPLSLLLSRMHAGCPSNRAASVTSETQDKAKQTITHTTVRIISIPPCLMCMHVSAIGCFCQRPPIVLYGCCVR